MTSNNTPQLVHGEDEDDPYKSQGHIHWRIENLTGFVQEPINSERTSDPVYLRGVPWKICTALRGEPTENGKKQRRLDFYLEYNGSTDPSCNYLSTIKLKILAQKKGGVDHVYDDDGNFEGIAPAWDFLGNMKVEDLMDPDKGWYSEQSDSVTLAMDLTVNFVDGQVGEYVLVAQSEFALIKVPINILVPIGNLQWQINYYVDDDPGNVDGAKSVVFSCKDVAKGWADKVFLELFGYHRDGARSEAYSPIFDDENPVYRHLFTRSDNSLTVFISGGSAFDNLLFILRVYKESSQFPDFTKPNATVGRFSDDVKLRVGDQQFHVNRQMLSMHSLFFDRMFHGDYTAATQQEVELSLITHSAELFHQFLLVMCVNEILPSSVNISAFFRLADFYDAENVRQKCDQHLRMAREMPIEKRVLLARDHGTEQTQDMIVESANPEQLKAISRLLIKNR